MSSSFQKKNISDLISIFQLKIRFNEEQVKKFKNKGNPPGSDGRTRQIIRTATNERFEILYQIIQKQQEQIDSLMFPLPAGWKKETASDGEIYYHNENTGEASWERPSSVKVTGEMVVVE